MARPSVPELPEVGDDDLTARAGAGEAGRIERPLHPPGEPQQSGRFGAVARHVDIVDETVLEVGERPPQGPEGLTQGIVAPEASSRDGRVLSEDVLCGERDDPLFVAGVQSFEVAEGEVSGELRVHGLGPRSHRLEGHGIFSLHECVGTFTRAGASRASRDHVARHELGQRHVGRIVQIHPRRIGKSLLEP